MSPTRKKRLAITTSVAALLLAVLTGLVVRSIAAPGGPDEASGAGSATTTASTPSAAPPTSAPRPTAAPSSPAGPSGTSDEASSTVEVGGPSPTGVPTAVATDGPVDPASGSARVTVTYAALDAPPTQVRVSAFVAGVVEGDGTCTATVEAGGASAQVTVSASADATTTTCADMVVPWTSEDSATVRVTYTSDSSDATSDEIAVGAAA